MQYGKCCIQMDSLIMNFNNQRAKALFFVAPRTFLARPNLSLYHISQFLSREKCDKNPGAEILKFVQFYLLLFIINRAIMYLQGKEREVQAYDIFNHIYYFIYHQCSIFYNSFYYYYQEW